MIQGNTNNKVDNNKVHIETNDVDITEENENEEEKFEEDLLLEEDLEEDLSEENSEEEFPEYEDITRIELLEMAKENELDILDSDEYLSKETLYNEVKQAK